MTEKDIVLQTYTAEHIRKTALPLIVIYGSPADYPGKFAARLWDGRRPTELVTISDSLEAARSTIPQSLAPIERTPYDDPSILEVWI
ncbi:MAG: hypothetical protein ACI4HO_08865 [Ruminococcus sp.]